jgi:hypothetical protein
MFTTIGVLIIMLAVGLAVFKLIKGNENPFTAKWTYKKSLLMGLVGLIATSVGGMFFINKAGTATSIQYLWGGDKAVTTQGVKLRLWGKTIPISFEIAMQDIIREKDAEGNLVPFPKEEGIYYRKAQRREFADAIKADIAASLIISVDYSVEEDFLKMADKIRSEQKLVYARIYPVYDQALKNTCKLMDAQDYISGASSQFDFYLKDQMENGMYITEEDYERVEEMPTNGDSTRTVAKGKINDKREKKYRIKRYSKGHRLAGEPVRDESVSLKKYGLTITQAAVTNIDWEPSFDARLGKQKEQVAQTQLEKQEAEKEFYATQKAIAKGEREKAEVRVKLEKSQLEQTIAAETRAKVAKYKEDEENNLLAASKKKAQRIRVQADADAYEIRKKVVAGITPEKRLKMDWDGKAKVMGAIFGPNGVTLPTTVMGGSGGNNSGMLSEIIGAKILSGDIGIKK